jgi:hypothetical protein
VLYWGCLAAAINLTQDGRDVWWQCSVEHGVGSLVGAWGILALTSRRGQSGSSHPRPRRRYLRGCRSPTTLFFATHADSQASPEYPLARVRRLNDLRCEHILYFTVDMDPPLLG